MARPSLPGIIGPPPEIIDRSPTSPELPPWVPPQQNPQPSANRINSTTPNLTPREQILTVAAEGSAVPLLYGEEPIGPMLAGVWVVGSFLYLRMIWCLGEIDGYSDFRMADGSEVPSQIDVWHYNGTSNQPVDPTLSTIVPGYSDDLVLEINGERVGLAYTVARIHVNAEVDGFPLFQARIRGKKVRDPRRINALEGLTFDFSGGSWSNNTRLPLAYNTQIAYYGSGGASPAIRNSNLSGSADSTTLLIAGAFSASGTGSTQPIVDMNGRVAVWLDSSGSLHVKISDSAGTTIGEANTNTGIAYDNLAKHSFAFSVSTVSGASFWDLAIDGKNIATAQMTVSTAFNTSGTQIDLTTNPVRIGGDGTNHFAGLIGGIFIGTSAPNLSTDAIEDVFDFNNGYVKDLSAYSGKLLWLPDGRFDVWPTLTDHFTDTVTEPIAWSGTHDLEKMTSQSTQSFHSYVTQGYGGGLFIRVDHDTFTGDWSMVMNQLDDETGIFLIKTLAHGAFVDASVTQTAGTITFRAHAAGTELDLFTISSSVASQLFSFTPNHANATYTTSGLAVAIPDPGSGQTEAHLKRIHLFPQKVSIDWEFKDWQGASPDAPVGWTQAGTVAGTRYFEKADAINGGIRIKRVEASDDGTAISLQLLQQFYPKRLYDISIEFGSITIDQVPGFVDPLAIHWKAANNAHFFEAVDSFWDGKLLKFRGFAPKNVNGIMIRSQHNNSLDVDMDLVIKRIKIEEVYSTRRVDQTYDFVNPNDLYDFVATNEASPTTRIQGLVSQPGGNSSVPSTAGDIEFYIQEATGLRLGGYSLTPANTIAYFKILGATLNENETYKYSISFTVNRVLQPGTELQIYADNTTEILDVSDVTVGQKKLLTGTFVYGDGGGGNPLGVTFRIHKTAGLTAAADYEDVTVHWIRIESQDGMEDETFTRNPALIAADIIESNIYGFGATVQDVSLAATAEFDDEDVDPGTGTTPRWQMGLALVNRNYIENWLETIRAYGRFYILQRDGEFLLVPDNAASSQGTVTTSLFRKIPEIRIRPQEQRPTVISVRYTDTSVDPWTTGIVSVQTPEVDRGETERLVSNINMRGFQHSEMARRWAIERLNEPTLITKDIHFDSYDEMYQYEIGDVIALTHPIGLTAQEVRILGNDPIARGTMRVSTIEYNSLVYSNQIIPEPTPDVFTGDSALSPPVVQGLAITEEFYIHQGTTSSRMRITWTEPEYAFIERYILEIREDGVLIVNQNISGQPFILTDLTAGKSYSCRIAIRTTADVVSSWSNTAELVSAGAGLAPDFSEGLVSVFEYQNQSFLRIDNPAVDIDLWGYEWRRIAATALQSNGGPTFTVTTGWNQEVGTPTIAVASGMLKCTATAQNDAMSTQVTTVVGEEYHVVFRVNTGGTAPEVRCYLDTHNETQFNLSFEPTTFGEIREYVLKFVATTTAHVIVFKLTSATLGFFELERFRLYGPTDNWSGGTLIDRTPMLLYSTSNIPRGTWYVMAKALDTQVSQSKPFGNESADYKAQLLTVTDETAGFFFVDEGEFIDEGNPTLIGMEEVGGDYINQDQLWATEDGTAWNTQFTSNMNTYTSPLLSYDAPASASYESASKILPSDVSGTFRLIGTYGSMGDVGFSPRIRGRLAGGAWSYSTGLELVGTFDELQAYISADANRAFFVRGDVGYEIEVVPKTETGTITTNGPDGSNDPQPKKVTTRHKFAKAIEVRAFHETEETLTVLVDNISVGDVTSFDLVTLDLSGNPVSKTVTWEFRGV